MKPVKSAMSSSSPSITRIIMSVSRIEASQNISPAVRREEVVYEDSNCLMKHEGTVPDGSEEVRTSTLGRFVVFSPKEIELRLVILAREFGCGLLVKTIIDMVLLVLLSLQIDVCAGDRIFGCEGIERKGFDGIGWRAIDRRLSRNAGQWECDDY